MTHPTLQQLLSQSSALPSIPKVVALILRELDCEDPSPRKITALASMDPMLAGRMLRLANSAFFGGGSRDVSNIDDAFSVLGISQMRTLVAAVALGNTYRAISGIDLESFWRYSLNSAKLARPLARSLGLNDSVAFTAALLHAVGELVLCAAAPTVAKVLAPYPFFALDRVTTQRNVLGYSFVEVSSAFAQQWEFPAAMVDLLNRQDEPGVDDDFNPMAAVIHMASWRARTIELRMTPDNMLTDFPYIVAEALNLDMARVLSNDPGEWTSSREIAMFMG